MRAQLGERHSTRAAPGRSSKAWGAPPAAGCCRNLIPDPKLKSRPRRLSDVPFSSQSAGQALLEEEGLLLKSDVCPEGTTLAEWVEQHGGCLHPALRVVLRTRDCGCRGVVATSAIPEDDLAAAPLIAVPERLYLTTAHTRSILPPHSLRGLSGVMQLALALAYERAKGSDSFWHPYIAALPNHPPVAWLMPEAEMRASLDVLGRMGIDTAGWADVAARTAQRMWDAAHHVAALHGTALGLEAQDVVWAAAQVVSRAFGAGDQLGMAPLIDLCNHQSGAATPACWIDPDTDETIAYIAPVTPLRPGDELYVSYLASCTPLTAWLNFGFVPPETQLALPQPVPPLH